VFVQSHFPFFPNRDPAPRWSGACYGLGNRAVKGFYHCLPGDRDRSCVVGALQSVADPDSVFQRPGEGRGPLASRSASVSPSSSTITRQSICSDCRHRAARKSCDG
jgi:hypothetical protein